MDVGSKVIPLHLHPLGFIESFTRLGIPLQTLLSNTDINENMIESRDTRISYRQFNKIIKNGIVHGNTKGLGLLIGKDMDWSYHGTMGSIVYCSPSLKDAFDSYFRFHSIAQPFHAERQHERSFLVDKDGIISDLLHISGPTDDDSEVIRFRLELQLAIKLRICELCGNRSAKKPSVYVYLEYPEPSYSHMYQSLPCEKIKFGCDQSRIAAHMEFVHKPWRKFRRAAFYRTIAQCEEELQTFGVEGNLSSKVRWLISTSYFHRKVTLEKIAKDLHMTPRALTRRLSMEDTSFRNLYHDVRMEITSHHLRYSSLNIEDISRLMRFSNTSSLRRAIKNWSGSTAGVFRNSCEIKNTVDYSIVSNDFTNSSTI